MNAHKFLRAFGIIDEKIELLFGRYGIPRTGNDAIDFRN